MRQRPYAQNCALATALDVVGDRWALLVVHELLLGPKRFTDLVTGLPGGGTNTLAARGALTGWAGAAPGPATRVRAPEPVLLGVLRAPVTLPAAIAAGAVTIDGDGPAFAALVQACAIGAR